MNLVTGEFSIAVLSKRSVQLSTTVMSTGGEQRQMLTEEPRALDFVLDFASGERMNVRLVGSGREPTSFWKVLCSFREIASLPSNWDSYGSRPLSASVVRRSFNLLPLMLSPMSPEPTLVPTADGGIQFEWHRAGIDVELKIPHEGSPSYLIADASSGFEQEAEGLDLAAIRDALERLSQAR